MTRFIDIQEILDRILGIGASPNHGSFWRGVTRDEFVKLSVYGFPIIVVGYPEQSNLVKSLRGLAPFGSDLNPPTPGAIMPRMPKDRPPASEPDIQVIEEWIRNGCPDTAEANKREPPRSAAKELASDDTHIRYWRAIDDFFLPSFATPEAREHVGRMHMPAYAAWLQYALLGQPLSVWTGYLSQPDNRKSFEFVRTHQRRLLTEYYDGSLDDYFDSIWKFGGNLLPEDPLARTGLPHTMNGVSDWFVWIAHVDATLRASDISDLDLAMARGWQIGIVADGLLRTADDRPVRIPINDFDANDPNLQKKVTDAFANANANALLGKMLSRAKEARHLLIG